MAITKKYVNEILGTVLILSALLSTASAVDCNGKAFHCVNSTHFLICVDLGGGVSQAIDNFFIACPPPTVCQGTNQFECEFPAPTTPATTLSNVISETSLPWEEVVTASSLGNATKEFSENYMNTEKITITAEYSVTTDATVDLTATNTSEFDVYNELNTTEIEPTLATEITTNAIETKQTVNENVNMTQTVPTGVENVTHTTTESKNLTETDPLVVDNITATVEETTTENIIKTDTIAVGIEYIAASATEQISQTINENLNMTVTVPTDVENVTQTVNESKNITETDPLVVDETVPTAVENVTQTVNESKNITVTDPLIVDETVPTGVENVTQTVSKTKNLTQTGPVLVDDITATALETTTDNIIITDTIAAEIEYIAPNEQVAQTINENTNMTETVPTDIENVTQTVNESKNITETGPVLVDNITTTALETTTDNIIVTDTIAAEIEYNAPNDTEHVAQTINESLYTTETVPTSVENVTQTLNKTKNITETGPVLVDDITTTALETTTDNIIVTDTIAAEIEYIAPNATEQVAQTINENLNMTETLPTGVENLTHTTTESKNLTETDPLVVDDITATVEETTTENIIKTDTIAVGIEYIAASATEQISQTINENLNMTVTVPTGVENVRQTVNESKNITETGPVLVDDITGTALETTTDNIFITDTIAAEIDYIAPSATVVAQPINENLYTTETVPKSVNKDITTTVIESVTQTTAESGNLTQTEHVETYEMMATTIETTTDNKIITDSIGTALGYIEPTATEPMKQTTNDNLLELETVQSNTEPPQVTILFQNVSVANNTLLKDPSTEHKFPLNKVDPTSNTANNINISNLDKATDLKTKNKTKTEKTDSTVQNNLPVTVNTTVEPITDNVEHLITILVDMSIDDYTTVSSLDNKFKENLKPETVNASQPSKLLIPFEGSVRPNASIVINKQAAANEIENKEKQMLIINDPVIPNNIAAFRNRTQEVKNIIDARVVGSSINSSTSLIKEIFPEVTVTTDVSPVYAHDAKENVLHTSTNKSLHENNFTTVSNATNTLNPADTTVLGGTEKETGASTQQPTTLIEDVLTTDTTKMIVTENTIPPSQAVNLETINKDTLLTTVSNAQPVPTAFEDNMKFEIPLPVTENIVSTVDNGASTNGLMTVQSVNMDTITTEAVDIPTTISDNQPMSPDFEEAMKAEPSLGNGAPATENIVTTVNSKADTNIFMTPQALDLDIITTDAMFMPTTVSYGQALAFEAITTGVPFLATENILSSVNNGASTKVFITSHAVNAEIINTEAMYIPNPISNAQPIAPTFEDSITTDVPLSTTENILSSVNNGASTNGLATIQAVNVDTINTDAMYIPTTITSVPPMTPALEDNMNNINVPLPATVNVISSVNNGVSTNGLTTAQAVNVDSINAEAVYIISTTISNAQPIAPTLEENITTNVSSAAIAPTFEDSITTDVPLSTTENILSSVNNGASTNGLATIQAVNVDTINTDAMYIPTTITSVPLMTPALDDNMNNINVPLPATVNVISSVNNGVSTNGLTTAQAVNVDSINAEAVYISTTISNAQPIAPTLEENITTNVSSAAIDNSLTSVNNGSDINGLTTAQAANLDIINAEAIRTTVTNASPTVPAFEENIATNGSLAATENILSSVTNGASTNGLATTQAVNVDTINTDGMYIATTITSAPPMAPAFEDNMNNINVPLPATANVVSSVNNGVSTNGLTTAQAVNVDSINTEAMYISTTISNAQPIAPAFEENITTNVSLAAIDNILTSVNNGSDINGLTTAQAANVDITNAEAMPTTVTNASPKVPAFEENITTNGSLASTENTLSSENNGTDAKGLTTTQAVNVDSINTDTMYTPITITNAPPVAPAFKDNNVRTDVPSLAKDNMVSSVNNGASSDGFMTTQAVNVDIMDTASMYMTTTIKNALPMAPTFGDNTRTETTLSAPKNIISPKNNDSTNGFMIANPVDLEQITQKAGLETIVQLTPDKYVVPSKNVIVNNEKITSSVYGDIITKESGASVPVIIKKSPNTIIQKTQIMLNSSTDTGVKLNAIESDVNENYNYNRMTTIDTKNMYEIGEKHIINNILNSTVDSISHVSQIGARNTENTLFPNAQNHQNDVTPAINKVTANVKPAAKNVNEQAPVNNVAFSQTGASPIYINGNIAKATTTISISTSGFDSAFDISNQNWTSQQGESKTKQAMNNLQPSIVEDNDQADNMIWNPLANQVFNNPNQNPESVVTSSVTNIDDNTNVGNAASLDIQSEIPVTIDLFNLKTIDFTTAGIDVTSVPTTMPAKTSGGDITIRDNIPISNITFSAHTTNKPVLMDLESNSQAENTVIITESYKSENGIQDSGNTGDITTVPRIRNPAFNLQIGITNRVTGTTIAPIVGVSTTNSQTSGFAKTVSSATFNSQTRVTDGADVLSQPLQQVEKIPNIMASAPNNAHVVPGPKPSGSGIITNNPDNLHSPSSSNNVNTGRITPESVSESNFESPKSENSMPHDPVIGYQKRTMTVVTDLKLTSQNISFNTEKAPPNSIGSNHMQTQQSNPTKNTSSIFTPAQKISTSTARTPSQMATSNSISHINNNLTKQVPTVAAQTFSCIYGIRGRYSDKGDCRKFYICIGNNEPIVGYCPENTVFSDLKKLCTKNMSHCIRENQFKCPSVGRFSDFMKDNVYYICVNHKNNLYRFKFQCQKGYILDKTTVKCIETKEIESNESVSISSDNSSQTSSSAISSSTSSKSISKNSSRADDSSSKSDNSSKSKKSNEAEETSEKSEGKDDDDDDDDDEVFKCKKEGKFPIRNECRRYYLCKKNRRSQYRRKIKKCDSDQVFHKNKKKCVDDDSYEC